MRRSDPTIPSISIDTIIVSQSDMISASPFDLAYAVSRFVDEALSNEYLSTELPREALISHWVFAYEGKVMNGGHAQFVTNIGGVAGLFDLVTDGLTAQSLTGAASIFSDLRTFSSVHAKRFGRCYGDHNQIDPYFYELDDRFYALPEYGLTAALGVWLRSRPWISVVPDDLYLTKIGRLVPDHPLRDARRELRRPAVESQISAFFAGFARLTRTKH